MKPLIAVIGHTELNRFGVPATSIGQVYASAIEKAGGMAIIIPFTEDHSILAALTDRVQGLLFPGGKDLDPSFYKDTPVPELGETDPELDRFQMALLDLAIRKKKPVLGICRGIQLVNVALGGSLFQDIPTRFTDSTLKHMQDTISFDTDHAVNIEPGSRLHNLFGPHIQINSRHHQSVKEPGHGLRITARAPDGVVEALEHTTLPIDLVQWHPELMLHKDNAMLPLFTSFVEKCALS